MRFFKRKIQPRRPGPHPTLDDPVNLNIRIPRALRQAALRQAQAQGLSFSEFLRRLIKEAVK